uniref:Uncharacterized protein n=1 Tax=Chromera velia CCMP2878 TaxID=1169474 RepID=A0A0G4G5V9_9ALVE|mmetsp:Transcript_6349/g.12613  ORF Transcript_6349/g.12613 Transcript_6349/m.12613 type:complete len:198 (+) Transcript_6349:223-816(+)|eukprot:Cvel_4180.t1-p1 / transcript=Cvel_4180.t1 / gene=Cvel_4180 / organism=Chromera_velia_CCMP2878 / gene_product=hypothetical protein / transcript_product=hypothetical protein / location=Cvel_scaffold180:52594-54136(-) / protein_length=197 / sequence_SO=supercontig / SO=protein_coding / is_pseudo=false
MTTPQNFSFELPFVGRTALPFALPPWLEEMIALDLNDPFDKSVCLALGSVFVTFALIILVTICTRAFSAIWGRKCVDCEFDSHASLAGWGEFKTLAAEAIESIQELEDEIKLLEQEHPEANERIATLRKELTVAQDVLNVLADSFEAIRGDSKKKQTTKESAPAVTTGEAAGATQPQGEKDEGKSPPLSAPVPPTKT